MTKGYHTVVYLPFEGAVITEHATKKEALESYKEDIEQFKKGYFVGIAIIHIDVLKEKGDWRDLCNSKTMNKQ
jgi:hypothetical protein